MAGLPDWKQRQLEELGPEPEAPVLSRGNQSFLARRLSEVKASSGPVPSDLLDSWTDDNDSISAAFLLHPAAREGGSEHDVRHVLAKKQLDLTASLSSKDFTKLAARIQKRGSTLDVGEKTEEQSGNKRSPEEQQAVDALTKLTAEPKWRAEDATPDTFSSWLLCGSAEHASDLGALRKAGVTAVLNCASSACDDPVESYDEYGIKYMELDGEDFEGFPLLELHLEKATKFVDENSAGGIVLVYVPAPHPTLASVQGHAVG